MDWEERVQRGLELCYSCIKQIKIEMNKQKNIVLYMDISSFDRRNKLRIKGRCLCHISWIIVYYVRKNELISFLISLTKKLSKYRNTSKLLLRLIRCHGTTTSYGTSDRITLGWFRYWYQTIFLVYYNL